MPDTPQIDIRPDHWLIVQRILQKHVPQYEVWAFGSRAKWTANEYSDLDLAIITDKPLPLGVSADLSNDFSESELPWRVDVVDWATTSESFRKIIEKKKVVVQVPRTGMGQIGRDWVTMSKAQMTEYGKIDGDYSRDRLEDLCIEKFGVQTGPFGSQLHNEDYVEVGTPIITVEHLGDNRILHENTPCITDDDKERLSKYHLKEGDIVFSRVGSVDRRALVRKGEEGWLFSGRCLRIRVDKNKIDPVYLSYFFGLENFKKYIRSIAVGATMPSINTKILSDILIYYPEIEEQKRIGEILYLIDDKIELNRQINQTLEQIAQAIFKSWFIDFEPVKAKITAKQDGQDPERAAMCAISGKSDEQLDQLSPDQLQQLATTAALFPDELIDWEFGEIPKGWVVGVIGDLVEFNPKRSLRKGTVVPYLDMKNMPTKGHLADDIILREFGSGTKFVSGDTLLARITPCLENGKTAFVDFLREGEVGWGSTEYIVMRSKDGYPECFSYLIARYEPFRQFAIRSMMGTSGRQRANAETIEKMPWIVPEIRIANAFGITVSQLMTKIRLLGDSNKTLASLRDSLLPKLLSGEISLDNPKSSLKVNAC